MTKDHAEFIAARVPGAEAKGQHRFWRTEIEITEDITVGVAHDGNIVIWAYDAAVLDRDAVASMAAAHDQFSSALAASIAAGFPDLREVKDGEQ